MYRAASNATHAQNPAASVARTTFISPCAFADSASVAAAIV